LHRNYSIMFSTLDATPTQVAIFHMSPDGDQLHLERFDLSQSQLEKHHALLKSWLFSGFQAEEFFQSNPNESKTPTFELLQNIFDDSASDKIHALGEHIALSIHGHHFTFIISTWQDLVFDDEMCSAIVVSFTFPSEMFYLGNHADGIALPNLFQEGIPATKQKEALLLFNVFKDDGLRFLFKGLNPRAMALQIIKDQLLKAIPIANPFYHTKAYLTMCNKFVKERLEEDPTVSKTEKANVMQKTINFFKESDTFVEEEFIDHVFEEEPLGDAFRQYKNNYQLQNHIDLSDQFNVEQTAVQKQARVFKSVLKLDRNFHIYIHGDKSLIQKGVESDGRKFYKIYFEDEQ
jgi:hypothetical protein